MVRVRASAVDAARKAAAKAGVPLIDVLSAGALALAGQILTPTTPTTETPAPARVLSLAEIRKAAKGKATR